MKCKVKDCCCRCVNQVLLMDGESVNAFGMGCAAFMKEEQTIMCGDFEHNKYNECELYIAVPKVECALEFSPESPDCTPCKHYGECVTEAYSES